MRTDHCSGRRLGERVVGLPRGGLPRGCTPPPCGQTDTCKNITFLQLLLRTVIREYQVGNKPNIANFVCKKLDSI